MNGLGRWLSLLALDVTRQKDADDEWRALHRRPDALPLPAEQPAKPAAPESRKPRPTSIPTRSTG